MVQNTLTSTEVISALHMKLVSLDISANIWVHGVVGELQDYKEHPESHEWLSLALHNVVLGD